MEAGSHSGIARLVQQSLGTSALFPSMCLLLVVGQYIYALYAFGALFALYYGG
jgi:hypothetical protein